MHSYRILVLVVVTVLSLSSAANAHVGTAGHTHPHGGGLFLAPGVTILLNERVVDVSPGFVTDTRMHEKVLLETPDAVASFNELQMTYNSSSAQVRVLLIRRLRPDGNGHFTATSAPISTTTVQEERFEDALIDTMHIKLPECRPGDIIEYELVKSETSIMPNHFFTMLPWQTEYKTAASRLIVTVPKGTPVASKCFGLTITPTVAEEKSKTRYEWSLNAPLGKWDPASQPIQPHVIAGTPTTWPEVHDWYKSLFRNVLEPTPTVREKARELVGNAVYTPDKIKAIATYVCTTLKTDAYEIGAAAWRPLPGESVIKRGSGDCKAKAALLCTMLRSVGVVGQLALTYTATAEPPLADQLPSPFAFNHVVVAISGPGNVIWVDPTAMAAKTQYWGMKREVMVLGAAPKFTPIAQFTIY